MPVSEESIRSESAGTVRGVAFRLFLTCWIVYVLHFATNIVREIYPALSIGDRFSFRVDEYAHLHPDIFEKEGYGWHIDNNPGASMLAAVPYALLRPITDRVVETARKRRQGRGKGEAPAYESPWPMAREFYAQAWQRGLDIKFGLAAFVTQSLCMAPVSALGVVAMFWVLCPVLQSRRQALWLSLFYAIGTPIFFRTGTLNQNMLLGHIAFLGFLSIWNPAGNERWSHRTRLFLGGLAAGASVLMDYSGVILLMGLFAYAIIRTIRSKQRALPAAVSFIGGALGPVALLWLYQWQSFGHPFYPPQHHMPPINPWVETGYQGYAGPQWELLVALAFDYRFGLFLTSPILVLAFLAPWKRHHSGLPALELGMMISFFVFMWVFFSGSNYTRLQFNTGVRYLTAVIPFLFVPLAVTLKSLNRTFVYVIVAFSVAHSWCLAMYRDVERGLGVLEPVVQVFLAGFQLPALTTLGRMEAFSAIFPYGPSPLPLFAFTAVLLWIIWRKD